MAGRGFADQSRWNGYLDTEAGGLWFVDTYGRM